MKDLRARVNIDASPADVFRILTDFDSYASWNPWLRDVKGQATVGERVTVRPNLVSIFGYHLTYVLERIQPPDTLRWREEAWFSFLFFTVREYQVYTRASGGAMYSVMLRFYGPLTPLVGLFYGRAVRRGLKREAEALKRYAEATCPRVTPSHRSQGDGDASSVA